MVEPDYFHDFEPFFIEMAKELTRHHPVYGDSWKSWDFVYYGKGKDEYAVPMEEHLDNLLEKAFEEYQTEPEPTQLVDIANICAMRYLRGLQGSANE